MTRTPSGTWTGRLAIAWLEGYLVELLEDWTYTGSRGDTYCIPAGFRFDGATVPRWAQWFLPRFGHGNAASCLHDWLIHLRTVALKAGLPVPISSRDTDGFLRKVLADAGVSLIVRYGAWAAVRWASLFNPYRREWRGFLRDLPLLLLVSVPALALAATVIARLIGWL